VIPFANAKSIELAVPHTKIIPTEGKGHYRILWDEDVYQTILDELRPVK